MIEKIEVYPGQSDSLHSEYVASVGQSIWTDVRFNDGYLRITTKVMAIRDQQVILSTIISVHLAEPRSWWQRLFPRKEGQ